MAFHYVGYSVSPEISSRGVTSTSTINGAVCLAQLSVGRRCTHMGNTARCDVVRHRYGFATNTTRVGEPFTGGRSNAPTSILYHLYAG